VRRGSRAPVLDGFGEIAVVPKGPLEKKGIFANTGGNNMELAGKAGRSTPKTGIEKFGKTAQTTLQSEKGGENTFQRGKDPRPFLRAQGECQPLLPAI